MYQQGYQDGPNGNGQERAWYAAPPRQNASSPRRRSRSQAQADPAPQAPAQPTAVYQQPADPPQQNVYAGSPINQEGGYPSHYNNPYGNYQEQNPYGAAQRYPQTGYADQGYYAQPNGYYQQDPYSQQLGYREGYANPQAGYAPQQQAMPGYPAPGYEEQNAYDPYDAYPQQNGYPAQQQSGYDPNQAAPAYEEQSAYNQYEAYGQQGYGQGYRPPQLPPDANNQNASSAPKLTPAFIRNLIICVTTLLTLAAVIVLMVTANSDGTNRGGQNNGGSGTAVSSGNGAGTQTVSRTDATAYAYKFLPNVYVDGICLTDMTFQEGSDAVWAQAQAKQSGWYVRLKNENGSYKDITADMLGISFDPTAALQQAWNIGHIPDENGQVTEKALQQSVNAALQTEYHFTSAQQSANTSPIDTILDTLQTNAYRAPQDAVILSFNPDDFVNPFTFQQEVWGQWLDISAVKQEILNMVSTLQSGEVLLQISPIAPNVTVADLQKSVTLRCRAVTPISSSSTEERTNNIRVAFSKINGKSIAHGDKFSFNKFVGRRSIENGFFQAIEYAYGEEVMGIGGGVCQASTTVYLAAIQGGMTITDREAHSNPVNYTSLGMDATVSDTRGREVDFTFRNESGGRIFIAAHVVESGSNRRSLLCEVRIYGPSLEDVHYKLESETVQVLPKPEDPKLKEDESGEHAFYIDENKLATKGREGYVVDTYLCTYQGDTMISRDKVSQDTYPARQDVYWVGTNTR